jgi:CMP/dCMP kinase
VSGRPLIVAIDGPAGAGKSATARELALRLRLPYLDTGAMYRALALQALRAGLVAPLDGVASAGLVVLARALEVRFEGGLAGQRVLIGGEDVTEALRSPEVSTMASVVSVVPEVRREMVRRQREMAARTGGVIEGRDIGTVVFPEAPVKVFLTASPEVRAERRLAELRRRNPDASFAVVLEEQRARDLRDSTRADSPLKPAEGARVVDSSGLTLGEVVDAIMLLVPPGA